MILKRFSLTGLYGDHLGARVIDSVLLLLLCSLLIAAPLPFGSVEPRSLFGIQIIASVCFLLWSLKLAFCSSREQLKVFRKFHAQEKEAYSRAPFFQRFPFVAFLCRIITFGNYPRRLVAGDVLIDSPASDLRRTFFSIGGFPVRNTGLELPALLFLALLVLQLIPVPHAVSQLLSPESARLYSSAASLSGELHPHPFSVDAFSTFAKFVEYAAYFMIYLVLVNASPGAKYFKVIVLALIVSALFQASYGMMEYFSGHQHIFNYKKTVNDDVATGTFINRNHYASYLEMTLPFLLAMLAALFQRSTRSRMKLGERIAEATARNGGKILFNIFLVGLILTAIVCSLSRSGILFTTVTCFVFLLLFGISQRKVPKSLVAIFAVGLVGLVAMGILWQPLYARFAKISTEFTADRARLFLYRDTLKIFADFPVTGSGAGTFMQVFPKYKGFVTHDIYRYAHNDYLQLLAEIGFSGLLLMATFFYLVMKRLRRVFQLNGPRQPLHLGAFCAMLSVSLHSLTDFGVHIPAIALNAVVAAALFWRTPSGEEKVI